MDRWTGVLKVGAVGPHVGPGGSHFKVAASLCLSPSGTLGSPSTNALFFTGDRVERTGNPVIEELSDSTNVARLLVSKLSGRGGGGAVNAWVVDAATFSGPFAVYKELVPSVDSWGNPTRYDPEGFPASTFIAALLSKCVHQVRDVVSNRLGGAVNASVSSSLPKTILFGFSKGGIILNQILAEIASLEPRTADPVLDSPSSSARGRINEEQIFLMSRDSFLRSISEFHFVDVGLNCAGAYLTDHIMIKKIVDHICCHGDNVRFLFHGTPRQWCDRRRPWICKEKERLVELLEEESHRSNGKIDVKDRFYYQNMPPSLQMHFEIMKDIDLR